MLPSYTIVKKTAKTALKGKWTPAVIASSFLIVSVMLCVLVAGIVASFR